MRIAFLLLLLIFASQANTQTAVSPAADHAQSICTHIAELASDAYEGRKPGTPGGEKTTKYIAEQFRSIGLEPGNGDSYFQSVHLGEFSTIAPGSMTIKNGSRTLQWTLAKDFLLASEKAKDIIRIRESELVFAGFGIYAPEIGWDDYKDTDVKGKIVVLLSGVPGDYTEDSTLWKGDPAANLYGQGFYKRNEASARGATGVITIYKQPAHSYYTWESLGTSFGQKKVAIKSESKAQIDFFALITRDAANALFTLADMESFDFQKAPLAPGFKPINLSITTQFSFSNTWTEINTNNVVGLLPGTTRSDEVILYTAHWDHVGIALRSNAEEGTEDVIYNGAVDNASGTAALIEIAKAYADLSERPKRSILFIATAAEEMGLLGAVWYAAHPLFPLGKTVASLNMDSHFPYGPTKYITGVVYGRSELDGYLEEAARQQGRILIPNTEQNISQNIFFRSDHFPLAEVGIPSEFAVGAVGLDSVAWMENAGAYMMKYHQVTDEYDETFDCSGIWQDAELIFKAGYKLSMNDHFPAWNTDQPFQRYRHAAQNQTQYYKDVTRTHLPVMSLQGRSMDAKTADLDTDGDIDIVVANEHSVNIILINDGHGRFIDETTTRLPLVSRDSEDIAIDDFDMDGDPDIIFVSEDDQVNEYYENDGTGHFKDVSYAMPLTGTSNAVVTADLNHDGYPDLLVGNAGQNFCLINNGNGTWRDETQIRLPASNKTTQDLELADVDNDGDLDLVVANEDDNELLINNGKGAFTNETSSRLPIAAGAWETREADFADVDGDGDVDLLFANVNFRQNKDNQNRLFINDGTGHFKDQTDTHLPKENMHTVDADFIDFDNDGDLDILGCNGFGNSFVACQNDGKGHFTNISGQVFPSSVKGDGIDIEAADFNGDGLLDLYLCNFRGYDYLLFGRKGS